MKVSDTIGDFPSKGTADTLQAENYTINTYDEYEEEFSEVLHQCYSNGSMLVPLAYLPPSPPSPNITIHPPENTTLNDWIDTNASTSLLTDAKVKSHICEEQEITMIISFHFPVELRN